jgi:hypothetical protein
MFRNTEFRSLQNELYSSQDSWFVLKGELVCCRCFFFFNLCFFNFEGAVFGVEIQDGTEVSQRGSTNSAEELKAILSASICWRVCWCLMQKYSLLETGGVNNVFFLFFFLKQRGQEATGKQRLESNVSKKSSVYSVGRGKSGFIPALAAV